MALMLDTEVVLTAILARDKENKGVDYHDIRRYCDIVKQEIFEKTAYRCVNFGIDQNSLGYSVLDYPEQFTVRLGRYYRGYLFKEELFSYRNNKDINRILQSVACNF